MKTISLLLACAIMFSGINAAADVPVKPVLIGIYAQDYDDTVSWYSRNFGFAVAREVVNDAVNLKIGFLDNGAFELEIYSDIVADPDADRLTRDRFGMPSEGFVKLSLETDNLQRLADRLAENGVEFELEINTSDRKPGQSWFMVRDPDGNLIQVFGTTPETR